MKYEKQLKEAFKKTNLTQEQLGEELGLSRNSVIKRFTSKEIEKAIDFLTKLGFKITDSEGFNIVTSEKEVITIGNMTFTKSQLKDLKEILDGIEKG